MKVAALLGAKGATVVTMKPDATVATIAQRLQLERIGAIVLSEDGARIDGIIAERDIVHGLNKYGVELLGRSASELMTHNVTTCAPDDDVTEIMAVMTRRRIRHLPVVDKGRLKGIVSIGDVVKNRLDEMEMERNVLRDYITARS